MRLNFIQWGRGHLTADNFSLRYSEGSSANFNGAHRSGKTKLYIFSLIFIFWSGEEGIRTPGTCARRTPAYKAVPFGLALAPHLKEAPLLTERGFLFGSQNEGVSCRRQGFFRENPKFPLPEHDSLILA